MNENKKWYLYLAVLLIGLIFCLWYIFGSSIPNNGSGADAVRGELNTAGELIDSSLELAGIAEGRIIRVEDAVRDSLDRVGRIEERNAEIENRLTESLYLNRESQSIIQRVRERGEANPEAIN